MVVVVFLLLLLQYYIGGCCYTVTPSPEMQENSGLPTLFRHFGLSFHLVVCFGGYAWRRCAVSFMVLQGHRHGMAWVSESTWRDTQFDNDRLKSESIQLKAQLDDLRRTAAATTASKERQVCVGAAL